MIPSAASFQMISLASLLFLIFNLRLTFGVGTTSYSSDCPFPQSSYRPDTVVVPIANASDISLRLAYNTTQHVTLEIQNDIYNVKWFLGPKYSNTTIISKCGVGYRIANLRGQPPITINVASDIFIYFLDIRPIYDPADNSTFCCSTSILNGIQEWGPGIIYYGLFAQLTPIWAKTGIPPPLIVVAAKRVHVIGNNLLGRTTFSNTTDTIFDGNYVTTLGTDWGVHVTHNCDVANLIFSSVTIRNNHFNDTDIGVTLGVVGTGTACGVQIYNNNFTNFKWTAVEHGIGIQNVDCISNYVGYNFIERQPWYPISGDSGAIYFDTHWFGPNNTVEFNYLKIAGSGSYCFYIDYATSGAIIRNNICDGPSNTFKLNTGRNNEITNLLVIQTTYSYLLPGCENVQWSNCNPGNLGAELSKAFSYDTPNWKLVAPWASTFCTDKYFNGIRCNQNSTGDTIYGNCSGPPILNNVSFASVAPKYLTYFPNTKTLAYLPLASATETGYTCPGIPNVDLLNYYNQKVYTLSAIYRDGNDIVYINASSQLAKDFPSLSNFPYSKVGIKPIVDKDFVGILPIASWPKPTDPNPKTLNPDGSNISSSSSALTIIGITTSAGVLVVAFSAFIIVRRRRGRLQKRAIANSEAELSNNRNDGNSLNSLNQIKR